MDIATTNDPKGRTPEEVPALITLNAYEARTAAAMFERMFPPDEHGPGAIEIGVVRFVEDPCSTK